MLEAGETVEHCWFHCFGDHWGSEDRTGTFLRYKNHTLPVVLCGGWAWCYGIQTSFCPVTQISFLSLGNFWSWASEMQTVGPPLWKGHGKGKYGMFDQQDINQQGIKIITCKWCFHRITWWFCNYMQVVFCLVLPICYEFIKNPCQSFSWLCLSDEWYLFWVTNGLE